MPSLTLGRHLGIMAANPRRAVTGVAGRGGPPSVRYLSGGTGQ